MKRLISFILSAILVITLTVSACLPVCADFKYPSAYWPLQDKWIAALDAQDSNKLLTVATQTYDLLMPYGYCQNVCENLGPKAERASWICEAKGDIDGAVMWLERYLSLVTWLDKNGTNYKDAILNSQARLYYLKAAADPSIYALTNNPGKSYPGTGAPTSGTIYGSSLGGTLGSDSSALVYIDFRDGYSVDYWLSYHKNSSEQYNRALDNGGVIELAWNFSPEGTAGCNVVLESASDSYISEGLASMSSLGVTVLLRIGAEMNNWSDCDPNTYISAYRKIATKARAYSNIKLVFSPDNVSDRNHSFTDFYPGDDYVDWIGVSTYHSTNYASHNGGAIGFGLNLTNYKNDAYYGVGIYDSDPLVIIRPIVDFAAEHNKPMMISECGFAHRTKAGTDQTSFAADQMTKFYSYVNMIYPQIKAVYYFDNTLSGKDHHRLADNATVNSAYRTAISENGSYLDAGQASAMTWHELSELKAAQSGSPRIATYASFPGTAKTSVTYYIDGNAVTTLTKAPYYYTLNISAMTPGEHTVWATAKSGQFTHTTETYTINVSGGQWNWVPTKAPETTAAPVTTAPVETTAAHVTTKAPETVAVPETTETPETTEFAETTVEPDTAEAVEETTTDTATTEEIVTENNITTEDTVNEDTDIMPDESESIPETTANNNSDGDGVNPIVIAVIAAAVVAVLAIVIAVAKKKK